MSDCLTYFKIQISNWRWSWTSMILTGIIVPVLVALGLGVYAAESGSESLQYAIVAGLSFSLFFELQGKIASNIAFMKATHALSQFAVTGTSKLSFIVGSLAAFSALSIPALISTPCALITIIGVNVHFQPVIILAWVLASLFFLLSGIVVGALSSSCEHASSLSLLISIACMSFGSVAAPPSLLPDWLVRVGVVNPAVHIARLIRAGIFTTGDDLSGSLMYVAVAVAVLVVAAYALLPWRKL